jgi:uncharacterized protein with HEPN domain
MREPRRDKERLEHILAAIERVNRYIAGKTYQNLVDDDMMYYAVVKNIEIIGEAANMLTTEFQEAHPNTPWKKVKGMRNYIVHEYFQIDDIVVWEVATKSLVELKEQISQYLEETDWEEWEEKGVVN